MEPDYDVIVAGGGIAGQITAASLAAHSNQSARILVVDMNPEPEVGKKTAQGWVCGDAVSKRSVDYLAENLRIHYSKPELEHEVSGVKLYSPDRQTDVLFEGEGYLLNRKLLAQRQLRDSKKLGIEFQFQVSLTGLIAGDEFVTGVVGRNLADRSNFRRTARVVVDATGSASKLRTQLPVRSYIQREIDKDDVEAVGRCIYTFKRGEEDETCFTPRYCLIHFDQYLSPGGYGWVFPKGENKVNIGLGVQKRALDERNRRYGVQDSLSSLMNQYVAKNPSIRNPVLANGEEDVGNAKGIWQVSARRQNDCMVANGFAVVGDAAWMPRPIDAGGIGPSIYGSVILGRVLARALEANDVGEAGLWRYNVDYMRLYGYRMASFEVLRRYLQTISDDQINYGMKYFLSEDDIASVKEREHPGFNRARLLSPLMWYRILSHSGLARGLRYAASKNEKLITLNMRYPESPKDFPGWHKELMAELQEARARL